MVYKRYTRRRRTYRRRFGGRRSRVGRSSRAGRRYSRRRGRRSRIYTFKRTTVVTNAQIHDQSIGGGNTGAWTFSLSGVPSYTEFTNLFDMFRLNCVVLKFRWHQDAATLGAGDLPTPVMHYVIDNTDAETPTSVAQLAQYGTYKSIHLSRAMSFSIKVYPRVLGAAYVSAIATAYSPKKSWVATANYNTPHYGFKFIVDASQMGGTGENEVGMLETQATYYFQFKNVN